MSIIDRAKNIFNRKPKDPEKIKALEEQKKLEAEKKRLQEARAVFEEGMTTLKDVLAPSAFRITPNNLIINDSYVQTMFVFTYPRFLTTNWLSPIISYDATMDIKFLPEDKNKKNDCRIEKNYPFVVLQKSHIVSLLFF